VRTWLVTADMAARRGVTTSAWQPDRERVRHEQGLCQGGEAHQDRLLATRPLKCGPRRRPPRAEEAATRDESAANCVETAERGFEAAAEKKAKGRLEPPAGIEPATY
jgi:hypothetical protein